MFLVNKIPSVYTKCHIRAHVGNHTVVRFELTSGRHQDVLVSGDYIHSLAHCKD